MSSAQGSGGARRVVSLLPGATEIVGALGLAQRLVGVSHECDHPPEVAGRPRVTEAVVDGSRASGREIDETVRGRLAAGQDLYFLDEDLMRELAPDLILTQELCAVCAPSHGGVERFARELPGPPRVLNLDPLSLEEVFGDVWIVAEALGAPARGRRLVAELRGRVDGLRRRVADARERPRTALIEWLDPVFAAGHWNPELVEIAGGVEVLGRPGGDSVRTDWEALDRARPEVLVVACCGWPLERAVEEWRRIGAHPDVARLEPVRNGRVAVCDGSAFFSRPGPRLVDSAELLAALLHPDRCAGIGPPGASVPGG